MFVKKAQVDLVGIDKFIIGIGIPAAARILETLTPELLGFEHREPKYALKSKTYDYGLNFFNAPSGQSKKMDLIFGKKIGANSWAYHGLVQFISSRFDPWKSEEILKVIDILRSHLQIWDDCIVGIEFHADLITLPERKGWDLVFGKTNARKSRTHGNGLGYSEGKIRNGRGGIGKFYRKDENGKVYRIEIQLGKHKLFRKFGCKSIREVLFLDPVSVIESEGHFIGIRQRDWTRIIPQKPKRAKRFRHRFSKFGAILARKWMSEAERKNFHRHKKKFGVRDLIDSRRSSARGDHSADP